MTGTSGRRWATETGLTAAALVAAWSLARLALGAITPALTTAALGALVAVVLRKRPVWSVPVGAAAVATSALLWGVAAGPPLSGGRSGGLGGLQRSLGAAHRELAAFRLPLAHTQGVVFLVAVFAGLVAMAVATSGGRQPAGALGAAVAVTVWSAVVLPTAGAALGGLALSAAGLLVLFGHGRGTWRTPVVVATAALAVGASALGWSAVSGAGAASPGGRTVPAVAPSALSLTTDLTGIESRDATVVLFTATTRAPTYWQVATLTSYADGRWIADPATAAALSGTARPAAIAAGAGPRPVTARVTLSAYSGRLLPVPPSTVAVTGPGSPVVSSSGVVVSRALASGSAFTAVAVAPTPVADNPATSVPPASDTDLGPVPSVVQSLATSITGAYPTPLDRAEALVDFFRSGRFHYSVTGKPSDSGDPLVAFLTGSRTGSCEQFAGAFAVLARLSGLPTRVAVGFTPGRPSDGAYVVRGADAHAWPEVLINGSWVSFEPTPQLPSGELSPPGVLGPAALGNPNPTGPPPSTPGSVPVTTLPPTTVPATLPSRVSSGTALAGVAWLAVVVPLAVVVAAGVMLLVLRRRRRRRSPEETVLVAWRTLDRALDRRGMARPMWRTPVGHVRDLAAGVTGDQAHAALEDLALVAGVLERISFSPVPAKPDEGWSALTAARRARRAVLSGALGTPPSRPAPRDRATPLSRAAPWR